MRVKRLIALLSKMDQNAIVEFEIPADHVRVEVYPERDGDRYLVDSVKSIFYNCGSSDSLVQDKLNNRFVVMKAFPDKRPSHPNERPKFYVIQVIGDIEPTLHGPYTHEEKRDAVARQLRKDDGGDLKDGIYPADIKNGKLEVSSYSGRFFEE